PQRELGCDALLVEILPERLDGLADLDLGHVLIVLTPASKIKSQWGEGSHKPHISRCKMVVCSASSQQTRRSAAYPTPSPPRETGRRRGSRPRVFHRPAPPLLPYGAPPHRPHPARRSRRAPRAARPSRPGEPAPRRHRSSSRTR